MKKIYQIVYKGVTTNKITLVDIENYSDYKASLETIYKSEMLNLITTNIYYYE